MKVLSLQISNLGLVESEVIQLDKPLVLFYGEVRQGKSTILNAVRYAFGGAFPADIIRHGQKEAFVQLNFAGGYVRREFYRATDGEIKSRPITFQQDGKMVSRPVEALKKFLNPFLLDQDHLVRMTELERKKYFAELFNVDTTTLDTEAATAAEQARQLRAKVSGYGDLDLTVVSPVDANALKGELAAIREKHSLALVDLQKINGVREAQNKEVDEVLESRNSWAKHIEFYEQKLTEAREGFHKTQGWLAGHAKQELLPTPPAPDTSALEARISEAAATNVRAEQYQKNLARDNQRKADEQQVRTLEDRQRAIRDQKIAALKALSDKCGVPGLAFDEDGQFSFEGVSAGMLSTSQLMRLSSLLSALYPEGFGLDLIDRAESLGKSVFGFVDRAKAENKTILATIVGERPAVVPAEVGVFVVEGGKLS